MRTLARLLRFAGGYKLLVSASVTLGAVTILMNVGLLATAAFLIAAAALHPLIVSLTAPIYLVRFFGLSRAFARYFERLVSHSVTFKLLSEIRLWLYDRLLPLAPAKLSVYRSGDLLARVIKDIEELQVLYQQAISPIVVAVLTSTVVVWELWQFSEAIALSTLGLLVLAGIALPLITSRLMRGTGERRLAVRGQLDATLVDGVQGLQDILAFGLEHEYEARVAALNAELNELRRRTACITGMRTAAFELLIGLGTWVTLLLAIPLIIRSDLRGVFLAMLALFVMASFESVQPLASAVQFIGSAIAAGLRVFEIADQQPAVTDPKDPAPLPERYDIEFENVCFDYENVAGGEPRMKALRGVCLSISQGSRVAVVGPSGSGKTTIINLLERFCDPEVGAIRIGGVDLRCFRQDDLRAALSVVPQGGYVFSGTVRTNLLLSRPEASEDDMHDALDSAQLDGLVMRLPKCLDTWIGEQGTRLSGGERQRLAIARALLRDTPIFILDEPTANLDAATEREVLEALKRHSTGRTSLTVTHRLIEMEDYDRIIVMENGQVVETGNHDELMAHGGLYCRMYEAQSQMLRVA